MCNEANRSTDEIRNKAQAALRRARQIARGRGLDRMAMREIDAYIRSTRRRPGSGRGGGH